MNLGENILSALAGLKANKMRAFLTMLGIIIGISSVIMITTMGTILEKSVTGMYDSLGTNAIQFMVSQKSDAENQYMMEDDLFTMEMLEIYQEEFGDRISGIVLSQELDFKGKVRSGREELEIQPNGINTGYMTMRNMSILRGRAFSQRDMDKCSMVCVINEKQEEKLFGKGNGLGQNISVRMNGGYYDFIVVGIYEQKLSAMENMVMSMMATDWDPVIYIPFSTAQKLNQSDVFFFFMANGAAGENAERFGKDSADFFNRAFYSRNANIEVVYYTAEQELQMMTEILGVVKLVISIIAGVSLLVGGIGVMNIMLVSVTERTREIGVRKALGAPNAAIRVQFITESMIICLLGGIIGIIGGILLGNLAGLIVGTMAAPSVGAIIGSVLFSMAVGVFFGYYPANKAAKMDPIEALRYE